MDRWSLSLSSTDLVSSRSQDVLGVVHVVLWVEWLALLQELRFLFRLRLWRRVEGILKGSMGTRSPGEVTLLIPVARCLSKLKAL